MAVWGTGYEQRPGVHRDRAPRQACCRRSGPTPERTQDGDSSRRVDRGDARRLHAARHHGAREPRVPRDPRHVDVPWTNKHLTVQWEHFVSKLEPARRRRGRPIITGPDAKRAAAEMVATLYDASLDAFRWHDWPTAFGRLPPGPLDAATAVREPRRGTAATSRATGRMRHDATATLGYRQLPARHRWHCSELPVSRATAWRLRLGRVEETRRSRAAAVAQRRTAEQSRSSAEEARRPRAAASEASRRPGRPRASRGDAGAPAPDLEPGRRRAQEPQRDRVLLPAPDRRARTARCASSSPCPRR